MKKCCLFLFLILLTGIFQLKAQENEKKSLFVISPGYAIFNNGDQSGISFSNEYVRNIHKHFTYGFRYMFAHGEGNVAGLQPQNDIHISTTALDINGFYKPFNSDKHVLLLGLGISIDYTRISYLSNTDYLIVDDKIYTIADTDGTISLLEPVFDLRYYYNFTKDLYLGFNVNVRDLKLYQYVIGIGGGVKF
jgi:hypothetical protein